MKSGNIITLIVLGAIVILVGVFTYSVINKRAKLQSSESPAGLALQTEEKYKSLSGDDVDLSDYSNKIRVVNSWASWSPFSENDLKVFAEISNSFNEKEVAFLAINRKEPTTTINGFLESISIPDNKILFLQDDGDVFFEKVEGFAMPETLLFDAKGNLIKHMRGQIDKVEIETALKELLAN